MQTIKLKVIEALLLFLQKSLSTVNLHFLEHVISIYEVSRKKIALDLKFIVKRKHSSVKYRIY